jgi:hypothetical protein
VPNLSGPDLVVPARDGLFTSATLGKFSPALQNLEQHQAPALDETVAEKR